MPTPLELAREAARRRREAGEVIERLDPLERARRSPTSLRAAVTAKCWDCVGGSACDIGPRRAVRECSISRCPLHPVRPWQRTASGAASSLAEDDGPDADEGGGYHPSGEGAGGGVSSEAPS